MPDRILQNDSLAHRIMADPRWTWSQRNAAEEAARLDGDAAVMGLDQKMRPVIRARLNGPGQAASIYALLRNGAPAKPVMPYAERWTAARSQT